MNERGKSIWSKVKRKTNNKPGFGSAETPREMNFYSTSHSKLSFEIRASTFNGIIKNRKAAHPLKTDAYVVDDELHVTRDITRLRKTRDVNLIDCNINSSKRAKTTQRPRLSASPWRLKCISSSPLRISKTFRRRFIRCQPASAIVPIS